jgi:hypothetical protein
MSTGTDPDAVGEPSVTEVVGLEVPDYTAVRVQVEGPIRTEALPGVSGDMGSRSVGATDPVQLFGVDYRRKSLYLVASTAFKVGRTQQQCSARGATVPANVIAPIDHREEVWVLSSSGTIDISWLLSQWTG